MEATTLDKTLEFLSNERSREMTTEETKLLFNLLQPDDLPEDISESMKKDGMCQLISKRIKNFPVLEYEVDDKVLLMLAYICESPGIAVLYTAYLQKVSHDLNIKKFDIKKFCEEAFPWGFFKKESLEKAWDMQKLDKTLRDDTGLFRSDNSVDYLSQYKNISNYGKSTE